MNVKVHNPEGMSVHDISVEKERTYIYPDGAEFTIFSPKTLFLKQDDRGDSHRVVTVNNETFYPVRGWIAIMWINKDTKNPVQF